MASIAEQLIGSAQEGIKEQGQASSEMIQIAQRAEQHQLNKQKFEQQQQNLQSAKLNKFMNNIVQGAAMKNKKAQNLFFNKILPAQHQAQGLEKLIPLDIVKSFAGDPETAVKVAKIQAKLREGTMTEAEAIETLADPLKLSEFQVGPGELQTGLDALEGIQAVGQTGKEVAAQKFKEERFARTEARQEKESVIREQRSVRREERALAREDESDVTKFSTILTKAGIPELNNTMRKIQSLMDKAGKNLPGVGATGNFPDVVLSAAGKEMRAVAAELRNVLLKARSGGAVTPDEARRLLQEMGISDGILPQFKTDKQFRDGFKRLKVKLRDKLASIESGFNPVVQGEFQSRFLEKTGNALNSADDFFQDIGKQKKTKGKLPKGLTAELWLAGSQAKQDAVAKQSGMTIKEINKQLGVK